MLSTNSDVMGEYFQMHCLLTLKLRLLLLLLPCCCCSPTLISFNTLLQAYAKMGAWQDSLTVLQHMCARCVAATFERKECSLNHRGGVAKWAKWAKCTTHVCNACICVGVCGSCWLRRAHGCYGMALQLLVHTSACSHAALLHCRV
jgi:pentatricopeptide repeat protein